jgi:hypothetical protein
MKEINDFILNLFTSSDIEKLTEPNLIDDVVCATDSKVLISIPKDEVLLNYKSNLAFPNALNVIRNMEENIKGSIKVRLADIAPQLALARLEVDRKYNKCKECDGTGEVEWEYRGKERDYCENYECPVCNGSGEDKNNESHNFPRVSLSECKDNDDLLTINIKHLKFHPFQIYRLFMAAVLSGLKEIEIFYTDKLETITYIGNIKVVVVLMN